MSNKLSLLAQQNPLEPKGISALLYGAITNDTLFIKLFTQRIWELIFRSKMSWCIVNNKRYIHIVTQIQFCYLFFYSLKIVMI